MNFMFLSDDHHVDSMDRDDSVEQPQKSKTFICYADSFRIQSFSYHVNCVF